MPDFRSILLQRLRTILLLQISPSKHNNQYERRHLRCSLRRRWCRVRQQQGERLEGYDCSRRYTLLMFIFSVVSSLNGLCVHRIVSNCSTTSTWFLAELPYFYTIHNWRFNLQCLVLTPSQTGSQRQRRKQRRSLRPWEETRCIMETRRIQPRRMRNMSWGMRDILSL